MRGFFKIFFASFLALIFFSIVAVLIVIGIAVSAASSSEKSTIGEKAVLVLDISKPIGEKSVENPFSAFNPDAEDLPGLYNIIQLIKYAKTDDAVKGIYIKGGYAFNGFATSEELRAAILDFKTSKKFVFAYAEIMNQKGYYLSSAAEKVYLQPQGMFEWGGLSYDITYYKNLLDKLEIEPQIFYAGKFKSATEPFRATGMSDANKVQSTVFMNDLYTKMLADIAIARNIDTATLRNLSVTGAIQNAKDAYANKLVDGLYYDNDIKTAMLKRLGLKEKDNLNFIGFGKYAKSVELPNEGTDKIALIYADGEIMDGKSQGDESVVTSDKYRSIIRKARLDSKVKAIVLRVNSPGGSALASDVIWHELTLAKKAKPVIVSMGDVAASGGYYISAPADSVFANETTITGSIGVFSMIPNMSGFLKNKIGVTFDGVKTGPYADMLTVTRPLTEAEKRFMQMGVDSNYHNFKGKVASGRKKSMEYVDSIAQGRVWTGKRALSIGLVDKIGNLNDAINCAIRLSKSKSIRVKEYPESSSLFEQITGGTALHEVKVKWMKAELGEQEYKLMQQVKKVKAMSGNVQTRMPFDIRIN